MAETLSLENLKISEPEAAEGGPTKTIVAENVAAESVAAKAGPNRLKKKKIAIPFRITINKQIFINHLIGNQTYFTIKATNTTSWIMTSFSFYGFNDLGGTTTLIFKNRTSSELQLFVEVIPMVLRDELCSLNPANTGAKRRCSKDRPPTLGFSVLFGPGIKMAEYFDFFGSVLTEANQSKGIVFTVDVLAMPFRNMTSTGRITKKNEGKEELLRYF